MAPAKKVAKKKAVAKKTIAKKKAVAKKTVAKTKAVAKKAPAKVSAKVEAEKFDLFSIFRNRAAEENASHGGATPAM